jgi:predicted transcriptional regulator
LTIAKPFVFSIRAEYARRILDGEKTLEYRKRCPSCPRGSLCLIYESRGRGRIVGSFRRGVIYEGSPVNVWNMAIAYGRLGGIARSDYRSYFEGSDKAFGIEVDDVQPLDLPLPPGMSPPQSWARYKGAWPLGGQP